MVAELRLNGHDYGSEDVHISPVENDIVHETCNLMEQKHPVGEGIYS